eukprot:scaffold31561_cov55-Phaeocystis_antarctica.AAC.1
MPRRRSSLGACAPRRPSARTTAASLVLGLRTAAASAELDEVELEDEATVAVAAVPLAAVPLAAAAAAALSVIALPAVAAVPLAALPLAALPFATVPFATVPFDAVPLDAVPLAADLWPRCSTASAASATPAVVGTSMLAAPWRAVSGKGMLFGSGRRLRCATDTK